MGTSLRNNIGLVCGLLVGGTSMVVWYFSGLLAAAIVFVIGVGLGIATICYFSYHRSNNWRAVASSNPELEGKTIAEIFGPELAQLHDQHFSQKSPGPVLFEKDAQGQWHSIPLDDYWHKPPEDDKDE